jgi:hypothetical protein
VSEFLGRIAARAKGEGGAARPRLPARFERAELAPDDELDASLQADSEIRSLLPATDRDAAGDVERAGRDRGEGSLATDAAPPVPAGTRSSADRRARGQATDAASARPPYEPPSARRRADPAIQPDRVPSREPAGPVRATAPLPPARDRAAPPVDPAPLERARPSHAPIPAASSHAQRPVHAAPLVAAVAAPSAPVLVARATVVEEPVVVHIGRVEVRASLVEAPPTRTRVETPANSHEGPSLSEYLRGKRAPG